MLRSDAGTLVRMKAGVAGRILVGQGVSSVGDGVWLSIWAIYLTRVIGLQPTFMGAAVATAGLSGVLLAYPIGIISDRCSARNTAFCLALLRGLAMMGFIGSGSTPVFLVVAFVFFGTQSAAAAVKGALVCNLLDGQDRIVLLAKARIVQHIAYAAGAFAGSGVLSIDSVVAYRSAIALNAVSFLVYAVAFGSLPRDAPAGRERVDGASSPLKNYAYICAMLVTSAYALCWSVMSTALPLWIAGQTSAPTYLSAIMLSAVSIVVAAFQLQVTRSLTDLRKSSRACFCTGFLLAIGCLLFGASGMGSRWVATALIVAGSGSMVLGELYFIAARWDISIKLMHPSMSGRYQSITSALEAFVTSMGPAIMTVVVAMPHASGWAGLAGLFALISVASRPVLRWAVERSTAAPERA